MRSKRTWALAALALITVACAPPEPAAAGTYVVAQCDERSRAFADARFERTDGSYYTLGRYCDSRRRGNSLRIGNHSPAPAGNLGRISWRAPDGTRIAGVALEASLRRDGGHRSRLSFLDSAGKESLRLATGRDRPGGFRRFAKRIGGAGRGGFAALLSCGAARSCPRSEQARTWIRNVRLRLRDSVAPTLQPSGGLVANRWIRGEHSLAVAAADRGSGLREVEVNVNRKGVGLAARPRCALVAGAAMSSRLRPCPRTQRLSGSLDTRERPFRNGVNALRVCARDHGTGANRTCRVRPVRVDNAAPAGAFANRLDPDDRELISAALADAHSGLATAGISYRRLAGGPWREVPSERIPGGIRARIDSRTPPPGRYLLRLEAADQAGNAMSTSRRADGKRMVVRFPLLERTGISSRLSSLGHRVAYGKRPRLSGRLRDSGGGSVRGRILRIVERFEPGSLPRARSRFVRTDRRGRYSVRLSAGPSRRVQVRFGGDGRYLPSGSRWRRLAVLGRATLRLSKRRVRAGGRVRFRGKVGIAGAEVPAPGKVVELQARERGERRFRTVREALHTDARGRIRTSYRFGRFYRRPARFLFRLKVTRQAGWPYRAPSHSRARRLKVVPR